MTADSGFFGIPAPSDIEARTAGWTTSGATLAELAAFYKDYMSTDGWVLDAENSEFDPEAAARRGLGYTSLAYYAKNTDPVTTVMIHVHNVDESASGTDLTLLIVSLDDEDMPRAATVTTPLKPR
jgi:hypothetical protein